MSDYSDFDQNFKLASSAEWAGISKRNIAILAMWLTGLGIPPAFHEFVTAVFVAGNWIDTEEDEITLKRMARAISPGTDADRSILRAFERLKKASSKFYEWQEQQKFEVVPREVTGTKKGTKIKYKFPHYELLISLFHLPLTFTQKQIRAEVAKALDELLLPPPKPRKKRERTPEAIAEANARTLEQLIDLTITPKEAGLLLSEAWRASLDDAIIEEIIKSL